MSEHDEQQKLDLTITREIRETVADDALDRKTSLLSAINLAVDTGRAEDKEIYLSLGLDQAQWSRIRSGKAHFPPNLLDPLCDIIGNEIPLRWWARKRGYGLVRLKSHLEAELEQERAKNTELELKLRHFEEFQKLGRTG